MHAYHPLNLCQPDRHKSCGACCGLYNWNNHSRSALEDILCLQTDLFFERFRDDDLDSYRRQRNGMIENTKLFETIYNCEFLGFVNPERTRVGCMLHPEVTGRTDLRNHCFYGAKVCSEHFCPSYACLTTAEQKAVISSLDDWYLYGLVITDIDLVKEFFRHVENTIGDSIREDALGACRVREALTGFFSLKESWKFKSPENRLGKYYFSRAEYNIARIDYTRRWGLPVSRFDKILVSLESAFDTRFDVIEAEEIIAGFINRFIEAYDRS